MRLCIKLLLVSLAILLALSNGADPFCQKGIFKAGACCPAACGLCGGKGCWRKGQDLSTLCCKNAIIRPESTVPSCDESDPPCRVTSTPTDPTCSRGLPAGGACCKKECGVCGGRGCGVRSREAGTRCCIRAILQESNNFLPCTKSLAPCRIVHLPPSSSPSSSPTPTSSPIKSSSPSPSPSQKTNNDSPYSSRDGEWRTAEVKGVGTLVKRHEACAVMVDQKVILIGGRGVKPVSIYDPKTKLWTRGSSFDRITQIHHFQCVAHQDSVWIPTSWNSKFPNETNSDKVYEYNVVKNIWRTHPALPEHRRRGGAAAVVKGNLIYVLAGNRGGHGEQATSLSWVDAFNVKTKRWTLNVLPNVPGLGRDHVGAALIRNGDICIAGGRDGGSRGFFWKNRRETYCYSFNNSKWEQKPDFPVPRAGAMTGTTCQGNMMIAGGEGNGIAYKRVDVFDGENWFRAPDLKEARHGSGLAFANCQNCGHIFIPSGSGNQGGRPELFTTEEYIPRNSPLNCQSY